MSQEQERIARLILLFGIMGCGKTWFTINNLLPVNDRNLIFPANKLDRAYNGFARLNWEAIFERVTKLKVRDIALLDKEKYRTQRNNFIDAMGNVFWKVRGNVICPISAAQSVVFEAAIDQDSGFKKGGMFVDDFTTLIPGGNLVNAVKVLITEMRHRELDIFLAAHNPDFAPPRLFGYNPGILVFETSMPFEKVRKKGVWNDAQYAYAEEVRDRVNRLAALGKRFKDKRQYYCESIKIEAVGEGE